MTPLSNCPEDLDNLLFDSREFLMSIYWRKVKCLHTNFIPISLLSEGKSAFWDLWLLCMRMRYNVWNKSFLYPYIIHKCSTGNCSSLRVIFKKQQKYFKYLRKRFWNVRGIEKYNRKKKCKKITEAKRVKEQKGKWDKDHIQKFLWTELTLKCHLSVLRGKISMGLFWWTCIKKISKKWEAAWLNKILFPIQKTWVVVCYANRIKAMIVEHYHLSIIFSVAHIS